MPSIPGADRFHRVAPVRDRASATPPVLHAGSGERLYVHGPTGSRPPGSTGEEAGLPRRSGGPAVARTYRAPGVVDDLDIPVTGPGHLAGR
ncbi:hypothetical protein [Actinacidiphila glaucinigra]|uniref:Uncharacterized protein n=1 Tax=Actinacidiphila glaucinigra TaxID=235986 RepID=A0A239NDZ0_9ACTN|nr:hypothetical protein [Actinacidiphila glaucinigra]SNT52644.1 hypothetical protein SAMN05216252_13430 [Actinacidiphila glaucinigra]